MNTTHIRGCVNNFERGKAEGPRVVVVHFRKTITN